MFKKNKHLFQLTIPYLITLSPTQYIFFMNSTEFIKHSLDMIIPYTPLSSEGLI